MIIFENVRVGGGGGGVIRNGVRNPERGGGRGVAVLFLRTLENVRVGGGLYPERGTQSGTRGGTIRNGVRNPERGERVGGWRCFL